MMIAGGLRGGESQPRGSYDLTISWCFSNALGGKVRDMGENSVAVGEYSPESCPSTIRCGGNGDAAGGRLSQIAGSSSSSSSTKMRGFSVGLNGSAICVR